MSADSAIVIMCSQSSPSAAPTHVPPAAYSNRLCASTATDGPYMRSRVNVGMEALPLGSSLNLRGQASPTAQILRAIPGGTPLQITDGPDCVGGFVWWLALVGGQLGYIAEAGNNAYYIEPLPPNPLPAGDPLRPETAPFLREFARLRGNFQPKHSWSSDGLTLATSGASGSDSLWLYALDEPVLTPQIMAVEGQFASLAVRPGAQQALFGDASGNLRLWSYSDAQSTPAELFYLNAHGGAVSALAFSPDGRRFVSAGRLAYTSFAVQKDFAAIVWELSNVAQQAALAGHGGLIRALAFSPDGAQIASGSDDGTVRFWNADDGSTQGAIALGAPIVALDYSPDGRIVAVAAARSTDNLLLLDADSGAQIASYRLPTAGLSALDFNPDGRLLAVASSQGVFTLWDSQRHEPGVFRAHRRGRL